MALLSKVGSLNTPTSTGSLAVTDVGFKPKVVLFFPTMQTTTGIAANMRLGFGAAKDSTNEFAMAVASLDAAATMDSGRETATDGCILLINEAQTDLVKADLTSMDNGGFTLNFSVVDASARKVGYLALGGGDITDVEVSNYQGPAATGEHSRTGMGFRPDLVLFTTVQGTTAAGSGASAAPSFGMFCDYGGEGTVAYMDEDNIAAADTYREMRTDSCLSALTVAGAQAARARFQRMNSDGWTLNWATAPATGIFLHYVAIKGIIGCIGSVKSQTSTGNFTPDIMQENSCKALIFLSNCDVIRTVTTTAPAHAEISIGAVDEQMNMVCIGGQSEDAALDSDCDVFFQTDKIYKNLDQASAQEGDASFVSHDRYGFTLNQTDADPAQKDILYLAFAEMVSPFVKDLFTEGADTTLASHTPDIGGAWSVLERSGTDETMTVNAANDRLIAGTGGLSDGVIYQNALVAPHADVSINVRSLGALAGDDPLLLAFRIADVNNYYILQLTLDANVTSEMWKQVAGVWTQIGTSFDSNLLQWDSVKVTMRGSSIKYFRNGVLEQSWTDTGLTAAGKVGIGVGNIVNDFGTSNDMSATNQIFDVFWAHALDMNLDRYELQVPDLHNYKTDVIGY